MEVDTSPRRSPFRMPPTMEIPESAQWTRSAVARLRYSQSKRSWSLYWCDQYQKFHRYELAAPTESLDLLLGEIDDDPTAIFWG